MAETSTTWTPEPTIPYSAVLGEVAQLNRNPYQSPVIGGDSAASSRTMYVLAALGAAAASLYWAAQTLLVLFGVAAGSVSGTQLILPLVLIVLYAARAINIFKGDSAAVRGVLWLHGVGGAMALLQVVNGNAVTLQGIKVAIHIFGAVTAYLAQRSR